VLGLFFVSIFAEINSVDDRGMVDNLVSGGAIDIESLFIPHSKDAGYYRPLLGVSFEIDRRFFFADRRTMHLHNILLHLINVLLVFGITSIILPPERRQTSWLPTIAALLFGLHPLVTESVDWISGRTDPLATVFILLSALLVISFTRTRQWWLLGLALMALLPGIMTKESALGFFAGGLCLAMAQPIETDETSGCNSDGVWRGFILFVLFAGVTICLNIFTFNFWIVLFMVCAYLLVLMVQDKKGHSLGQVIRRNVLTLSVLVVGLAAAVSFFSLARKIVFLSNASRIAQTVKLMSEDINVTLSVFLGAFGFYVKKFFLPLPLNFAIREIDPLYQLAGIIALFFCGYLLHHRSTVSGLVLAGAFLLTPSFPLAFGTIAWTAYAERYMYATVAFWAIAICLYVAKKTEEHKIPTSCRFAGVVLLIVVTGAITLQRNLVWRTNLTLHKDTVSKSPQFKRIRNEYMVALINNGQYDESEKQYKEALTIYSLEYHEPLDLNMAHAYALQGMNDKAIDLYELSLKRGGYKSIIAYSHYLEYLKDLIKVERDSVKKVEMVRKYLANGEKLFSLNEDPLVLYRMGQIAMNEGWKQQATDYFQRAYDRYPEGNEYKAYSKRLVEQLKNNYRTRQ
jgi:tetratricopeptide (TPR) repeat protein